jgi:hypothetical protein
VGQYAIEALGEDLEWAIWHIAEPSSAMDSQTYGVAAPGQIQGATKIAAVLATTQLAALRARNGFAGGFSNEVEAAIVFDNDQHDAAVLTLPSHANHQHPPSMPTLASSTQPPEMT